MITRIEALRTEIAVLRGQLQETLAEVGAARDAATGKTRARIERVEQILAAISQLSKTLAASADIVATETRELGDGPEYRLPPQRRPRIRRPEIGR